MSAIAKNGSKSTASGLDLLHILQLILHCTIVTTCSRITPGHDRAVGKNSSKCVASGLDLLDILQLILNVTTVTTAGRSRPIHRQEWLQMRL